MASGIYVVVGLLGIIFLAISLSGVSTRSK